MEDMEGRPRAWVINAAQDPLTHDLTRALVGAVNNALAAGPACNTVHRLVAVMTVVGWLESEFAKDAPSSMGSGYLDIVREVADEALKIARAGADFNTALERAPRA